MYNLWPQNTILRPQSIICGHEIKIWGHNGRFSSRVAVRESVLCCKSVQWSCDWLWYTTGRGALVCTRMDIFFFYWESSCSWSAEQTIYTPLLGGPSNGPPAEVWGSAAPQKPPTRFQVQTCTCTTERRRWTSQLTDIHTCTVHTHIHLLITLWFG